MPHAQFSPGEYYHIYNRGVEKRNIFLTNKDRWRFLTLLFALQGKESFSQMNRLTLNVEHRMFDEEISQGILKTQYIELVSFCLMPNHFHLLVGEIEEGGISKFMQRILNAYTKYFNIQYKRTGHLFGGRFQSVHIDREEYLHYLSAYIHLNPRNLPNWKGKEIEYPWSSFQDFVKENRWKNFLNPSLIRNQFKNSREYQLFVEKTPIKESEYDYLIDSAKTYM